MFGLNALSFLVFAVVLLVWRPVTEDGGGAPERFTAALRAGGRYVRHAPVVRRILLRTGLFIVPASALWALLALVASRQLHLGASGYGLLLGALGVGAIAGAVSLPRVRAKLSNNQMLTAASVTFAVAVAVVALVSQPAVVIVFLVPAGVAWIAVLSTVNASLQLFLPGWVRARGLSIYQIVVFGGQGVAAFLWGLLAQYTSLRWSLVASAVLLFCGGMAGLLLPLWPTASMDRTPVEYWPEPHLVVDPDPDTGPVLVTVTYRVPPEREAAFLEAMTRVGRSRRRTGATQWGGLPRGGDPRAVRRGVPGAVLAGTSAPARRPADRHGPRHRRGCREPRRRARSGHPPVAPGPPERALTYLRVVVSATAGA